MAKIVNHAGKWYIVQEKKDEIVMTQLDPDRAYTVKESSENTRTVKQNAALHKYFASVAHALNDAGFSLQRVVALFRKADIEWTTISVKDIIWRNIQVAITEKESTAKLTQDEVTKVYRTVDFYLTDKVGIESIDFPSIESMIFEQNYKQLEQKCLIK